MGQTSPEHLSFRQILYHADQAPKGLSMESAERHVPPAWQSLLLLLYSLLETPVHSSHLPLGLLILIYSSSSQNTQTLNSVESLRHSGLYKQFTCIPNIVAQR